LFFPEERPDAFAPWLRDHWENSEKASLIATGE
jgi:hypothetical protein